MTDENLKCPDDLEMDDGGGGICSGSPRRIDNLTMPTRFVRKADQELVEAVRYMGDNLEEVRDFTGHRLAVEGATISLAGVAVHTGDWVMRDDDGRMGVVRSIDLWSYYRSQPEEYLASASAWGRPDHWRVDRDVTLTWPHRLLERFYLERLPDEDLVVEYLELVVGKLPRLSSAFALARDLDHLDRWSDPESSDADGVTHDPVRDLLSRFER